MAIFHELTKGVPRDQHFAARHFGKLAPQSRGTIIMLMKKVFAQIDGKSINQAVETSSKMEGLNLLRAKKDTFAVKTLKRHGRAFSL